MTPSEAACDEWEIPQIARIGTQKCGPPTFWKPRGLGCDVLNVLAGRLCWPTKPGHTAPLP